MAEKGAGAAIFLQPVLTDLVALTLQVFITGKPLQCSLTIEEEDGNALLGHVLGISGHLGDSLPGGHLDGFHVDDVEKGQDESQDQRDDEKEETAVETVAIRGSSLGLNDWLQPGKEQQQCLHDEASDEALQQYERQIAYGSSKGANEDGKEWPCGINVEGPEEDCPSQ